MALGLQDAEIEVLFGCAESYGDLMDIKEFVN